MVAAGLVKCVLFSILTGFVLYQLAFVTFNGAVSIVETRKDNLETQNIFRPRLLFHHSLNSSSRNTDFLQLLTVPTQVAASVRSGTGLDVGFKVRSKRVGKLSSGIDVQQTDATGSVPDFGNVEDDEIVPNVADKETVINLAKMTSNAYILDPTQPDWLNISLGFNATDRFGWEGDGLRGQVFSTEDNSTVVISFKGTSVDPRDKWRDHDRLNDNRFFSCCCGAQNPWGYAPVCDCQQDVFKCNSTCLTQSLLAPDVYYTAALDVMHNMSALFPTSAFWTVGHSLGGSLASLIGLTVNIPAVTFESPPERLPAERLGFVQPDTSKAYHFGNTADPVFMGACNGFWSSCSAFGFSFESQCFTGKRCVYDTVKDKQWRLSITNHRINYVIDNVLKAYDEVPDCQPDDECIDCFNWKFA